MISSNLAKDTFDLLYSSLDETTPDKLVRDQVVFEVESILLSGQKITDFNKIYVVGFGKASLKMYQGLIEAIGENYIEKAILVTHINDHNYHFKDTEIILSSHPFITDKSHYSGERLINFVQKINKKDLLIGLISGGGSAMVALPIDSISLAEKVELISKVLIAGIPEREANEIKKTLSKIKGGGLSSSSKSNQILNLFLSDERNHKYSAIASGPLTERRQVDSYSIIKNYNIEAIFPDNILSFIKNQSNQIDEGNRNVINNFLIGSRENLITALKIKATDYQFKKTFSLGNLFNISSDDAASYLIENYLKIYESAELGLNLIIATGEIQVAIDNPQLAKGGRNQHLAALMMIKSRFNFPFCFIAYATDGMDFLSGIAGAYYTNEHVDLIKSKANKIKKNIKLNQSYNIHNDLNTLLRSDKTGNNVSDFYLFSFIKE